MNTKAVAAVTFTVGVLVGTQMLPAVSAQIRTAKVTHLMTVDLDGWCNGKQVLVDMVENGPGTSERHYHPGYSFGYVIDGSQTSTVEGRTRKTEKAGDLAYEGPMEIRTAETLSPTKIFSVRLVEKGKPTTVRVP